MYLQVCRSLLLVGENTSRLNNVLSTSCTPRDLLRVPKYQIISPQRLNWV
jgi:hypothetical protein